MDIKYNVKSAERVLDLIEAYGDARQPMSLSVLAKRIGIPVSSCHGLVRTLQQRGYLYSVGASRQVYPTKRLFRVAEVINANDPILDWLLPELEALRDLTGETVILGQAQDRSVIYLEVLESSSTIRYSAAPGEHKPFYSSAIGKALLSTYAPATLAQILTETPLTAITANTITDRHQLELDLAATRQRGFSITRGENVADVMAIAIAVATANDTLGIALAGPLPRMEANYERHSSALLALRARLAASKTLRGERY